MTHEETVNIRVERSRAATVQGNWGNRFRRGVLAGVLGVLAVPAHGFVGATVISTQPGPTCASGICKIHGTNKKAGVSSDQWRAQKFTTGSNMAGYTLTELLLKISSANLADWRASIWSANNVLSPGTKLFDWVPDHHSQRHTGFFTAPPDDPNTLLEPNTTYFIVAKAGGTENFNLGVSRPSYRKGEPRWKTDRAHIVTTDGGVTWPTRVGGNPLAFRLLATTHPSPVRLRSLSVTTSGGAPVDLDMPWANGALFKGEIPHGTDEISMTATAGDSNASVEIDSDLGSSIARSSLTATPEISSDLTEIRFRVIAADNESSKGYTLHLRRRGESVQAPATGEVLINSSGSAGATVGDTLTATARNVTEPNGTYLAETGHTYGPDGIATVYGFHFMWFANRNNSDNRVFILGYGHRLRLTENMVGQRISVEYRFIDDLHHREILSSEEFGPVVAKPKSSLHVTTGGSDRLTAQFAHTPQAHDGATPFTLDIQFSEVPAGDGADGGMKNIVLRRALEVTGGAVTRVRAANGNKAHRTVTIAPDGNGPVDVTLQPSADCAAPNAICTRALSLTGGQQQPLAFALLARIQGSVVINVADTQITEGPGVDLAFQVSLSRAPETAVSVDYATSDGTATAGADYTATTGTLTFAPGVTRETVSVPVLDDAHDEGQETMTLTLSNASGAIIGEGAATGTISNSDAMPVAWLARFGRTVGEQAMQAVQARIEAPRAPGSSANVAGYELTGSAREDADEPTDFDIGALTDREMLAGSSFSFSQGEAATGIAAFWGSGAVTSFDGNDGDLTLDGTVASMMLGADVSRDGTLAGLMLAHSVGDGGYGWTEGDGEIESTLTALYPYVHQTLTKRLSLWGMAGWGEGTLTLTPRDKAQMRPDMDLLMGAVGIRGILLDGGGEGMTLTATSDAFALSSNTYAVPGLVASDADVTRLRFALAGAPAPFDIGGDAVLTPSFELGMRHDGGDAETGFGVDIGSGLALSAPSRGISAVIRARGLLTHEDDDFAETGFSGTLSFDPTPSTDRGPSLTVTQTVGGPAAGGADELFRQTTLAELGADDEEHGSRLDVRVGYGVGAFGGRFTAIPEVALSVSSDDRTYGVGWRLRGVGEVFGSMEIGVEAKRREADHAVTAQLGFRW